MTLCEEQQKAVDTIMATRKNSIILTGKAGCGKSYLIRWLLKNHYELFTVCATTGMAAINVGGCTVDKLFSLNRNTWKYRNRDRLDAIMMDISKYIIIDEASMIGDNMADLLLYAARQYDKTLILVGDFAQSAPVKDAWAFEHPLFTEAEVINLTESHRQNEQEFLDMLNDLRIGRVPEAFKEYLNKEAGKNAVKLFATNNEADVYNLNKLEAYAEENNLTPTTLTSTIINNRYEIREKRMEEARLANNTPICVGCKVILTWNSPDGDYVNGDTGTVEKIESSRIAVALDRYKGLSIWVDRMVVDVKDAFDKVEFSVRGFPLRLGYAITIHKSQGMTLDAVNIDLTGLKHFPSRESRHGLVYVAVSRVRTAAGLAVTGYFDGAVECYNKARKFIETMEM